MRILVVDDEESILVPLEFLLKKAGHQVVLACTGKRPRGPVPRNL